MKRTLAILAAVCLVTVAFPVVADGNDEAPLWEDREDVIINGTLSLATPHSSIATTFAATNGTVTSFDTFYFVLDWDKDEPEELPTGVSGPRGLGIENVQPGDHIGTRTVVNMFEEAKRTPGDIIQDGLDQDRSMADDTMNETNTSEPFLYAIEVYFYDEDRAYIPDSACHSDLGDGDQRACLIPWETENDEDGGYRADAHYVEITALYGSAVPTQYDLEVLVGLEAPVIELEDPACQGLICSFDASRSYTTIGSIVAYEWDLGGVHDWDLEGEDDIPDPTFTYDEAGTYTMWLNVTNDAGVTATETFDVTVTG